MIKKLLKSLLYTPKTKQEYDFTATDMRYAYRKCLNKELLKRAYGIHEMNGIYLKNRKIYSVEIDFTLEWNNIFVKKLNCSQELANAFYKYLHNAVENINKHELKKEQKIISCLNEFNKR